MKGLVLCGGLGTRLGALTRDRPKPLLEVGPLALVEHTLLRFAATNVTEVFVNLCFRGEQLRCRLGDGARYGVRLRYFEEQELLGTAGTPRALAARIDDDLLLQYGDVLTDQDPRELIELHRDRGAAATLLVHQRQGSNSHADIDLAGRVRAFLERPATPLPPDQEQWAFSGMCLLGRELLGSLPARTGSDLPRDVFPSLAVEGTLFAARLSAYRIAIDSPARLEAARRAWQAGHIQALQPRAPSPTES